jgi:ferritin
MATLVVLPAILLVLSASINGGNASCADLLTAVPPSAGLGSREGCGAMVGNIKTHVDSMGQLTNTFITNTFEYMQIAAHFSRDTVNWDGFSKYFQSLSDDAWKNAVNLVKYGSTRGQNLGPMLEVKMPKNRKYNKKELEFMGLALDKEKEVLESVSHLLKSSAKNGNDKPTFEPLLNHYLEEEFAEDGVKKVRELSGIVNNFHAMSGPEELPLATFHLNQYLKK